MKKIKKLEDLEKLRKELLKKQNPNKICVIISTKSTCCYLRDSEEVAETFKKKLRNKK